MIIFVLIFMSVFRGLHVKLSDPKCQSLHVHAGEPKPVPKTMEVDHGSIDKRFIPFLAMSFPCLHVSIPAKYAGDIVERREVASENSMTTLELVYPGNVDVGEKKQKVWIYTRENRVSDMLSTSDMRSILWMKVFLTKEEAVRAYEAKEEGTPRTQSLSCDLLPYLQLTYPCKPDDLPHDEVCHAHKARGISLDKSDDELVATDEYVSEYRTHGGKSIWCYTRSESTWTRRTSVRLRDKDRVLRCQAFTSKEEAVAAFEAKRTKSDNLMIWSNERGEPVLPLDLFSDIQFPCKVILLPGCWDGDPKKSREVSTVLDPNCDQRIKTDESVYSRRVAADTKVWLCSRERHTISNTTGRFGEREVIALGVFLTEDEAVEAFEWNERNNHRKKSKTVRFDQPSSYGTGIDYKTIELSILKKMIASQAEHRESIERMVEEGVLERIVVRRGEYLYVSDPDGSLTSHNGPKCVFIIPNHHDVRRIVTS